MPFKLPPTFPRQPYLAPHTPAPLQPCPSIQDHHAVSGWDGASDTEDRNETGCLWPSNTPSICPQLLCFGLMFNVNNTFSSTLLSKLFQFPTHISWTKVGFLPLVPQPFEPSQSTFTFFLLSFMYISNFPCQLELKQRDSAVPHVTLPSTPPLYVYSRLRLRQVGSPPVTLTGGGFLRCQ